MCITSELGLPETNLPYFGSRLLANQVNKDRRDYMRKLLEMEVKKPYGDLFSILEIGSWAGESAVLWADKMFDLGIPGRVICIDTWKSYKEIKDNLPMMESFKGDAIFRLFLHNIIKSRSRNMISYVRGDSHSILPLFRSEIFDMVYIDGDHSYKYVSSDIKNAVRVLKNGGIICGDDLEIQLDKFSDPKGVMEAVRNDYTISGLEKIQCHIGVTVAVWEDIGKVSSWNGFWAMRKIPDGYSQIVLK